MGKPERRALKRKGSSRLYFGDWKECIWQAAASHAHWYERGIFFCYSTENEAFREFISYYVLIVAATSFLWFCYTVSF